jgi:hypothetical protein
LGNNSIKTYPLFGYFVLAEALVADIHQIVNQQLRFVLGDEHWNGLKKLRPTGRA